MLQVNILDLKSTFLFPTDFLKEIFKQTNKTEH